MVTLYQIVLKIWHDTPSQKGSYFFLALPFGLLVFLFALTFPWYRACRPDGTMAENSAALNRRRYVVINRIKHILEENLINLNASPILLFKGAL